MFDDILNASARYAGFTDFYELKEAAAKLRPATIGELQSNGELVHLMAQGTAEAYGAIMRPTYEQLERRINGLESAIASHVEVFADLINDVATLRSELARRPVRSNGAKRSRKA